MIFRSAALTDIGKIRKENEDRLLCDEELQVFGVADGIGGLPFGGEAAQITVDTVLQQLKLTPRTLRTKEFLLVIESANREAIALGRRMSPIYGVGTTLTCGFVNDQGGIQIAHVGDSRCYLLRGKKLQQITIDHNVENEIKEKEAAGEHPDPVNENMRSALTRCLGQMDRVRVDLMEIKLEPGDRLLFCTDGVTRMVRDDELGPMLSASPKPDLVLRRLIQLALDRGGYDNASAVLLITE